MKRFYKSASTHFTGKDFEVRLDDRPVRTPGRNMLKFPTLALAEASAAEWNNQGEKLVITDMPITTLAYATTDRVAANPEHFIQTVAKFAETDLLCYRATDPKALRDRQDELWDPLLKWFKTQFGENFAVTEGIMPIDQPEKTTAAVITALRTLDHFHLTSAHSAAELTGSAIIALALTKGEISASDAFNAAHIDDYFQLEEWGEDQEAQLRLNQRKAELDEIGNFLNLLN